MALFHENHITLLGDPIPSRPFRFSKPLSFLANNRTRTAIGVLFAATVFELSQRQSPVDTALFIFSSAVGVVCAGAAYEFSQRFILKMCEAVAEENGEAENKEKTIKKEPRPFSDMSKEDQRTAKKLRMAGSMLMGVSLYYSLSQVVIHAIKNMPIDGSNNPMMSTMLAALFIMGVQHFHRWDNVCKGKWHISTWPKDKEKEPARAQSLAPRTANVLRSLRQG